MRELEQQHKLTAKEIGRVNGSQELLAHLSAERFHYQKRHTNKVEIDMAYFLGYKEALQDFARLLLKHEKGED